MEFRKSESSVKPKKVRIAGNMAYVRKNIVLENRTDSMGNAYQMYVYDEAYCTKDEAINYLSTLNEQLEIENSYNNNTILDHEFRIMELEG